MRNKKYLVLAFMIVLVGIAPLTFSHVEEVTSGHKEAGAHEETSIGHQFEEILPFHHFAEGHLFAGVMLIILWTSFFYTVYFLINMVMKKKKELNDVA